jgi:hypothetical protein
MRDEERDASITVMTENVTSENWLHYSNQPKRKRADLVCTACHAKKIKCDLQGRRNDGKVTCSHCSSSDRDCQIRQSRREKKRTLNGDRPGTRSNEGNDDMTNGADALLAANATFQALTESNMLARPADIGGIPYQTRISPTSTHGIRRRDSLSMSSPQNTFPGVSQSETTPIQNGDVDSGFLQVYAPENEFDADNQAFVAQLEYRLSSELQPDLEQVFTETYFTYSYPWCPVLDRDTLSADVARSPLLANALALASSHIQPPLLPHDGPEAYYKRARTIFYDDEEADEMTALKALCLFYWWAPQSPSRVHRHSSW